MVRIVNIGRKQSSLFVIHLRLIAFTDKETDMVQFSQIKL